MQVDLQAVGSKADVLVQPLLKKAGIELVELKIVGLNAEIRLELIVDKPAGGINIEECARLNRGIVEAVEADGFLGEDFSVEVSSPGLDRPLVTDKDFKRNLNQSVRFLLNEAIEGKKELTGQVLGVNKDSVHVLSNKKKEVTILFSQIIKAMLVI